jgi:hypothetical protein
MADTLRRPAAAAARVDDEQGGLMPATCPLCHADAPLPLRAIEAGGDWQCARCGQHWDATRLATVAAYAAWAADHDHPGSRSGTRVPVSSTSGSIVLKQS